MARAINFILFILFSLTVKSQKLELWYPFQTSETTITDASGNGRSGTVSGATYVAKVGIRKGAENFSDSQDKITSTAFIPADSTGFTIMLWVNVAKYNGIDQVLAKYGTSGNNLRFCILYLTNNTNNISVMVGRISSTVTFVATNIFLNRDNKWTFYAIAVSQTNNNCKFYLNSNLFSTATTTYVIRGLNTSQSMVVGSPVVNQQLKGNGWICGFRFYSGIVSEAKIKQIYLMESNRYDGRQ